MWWYTTVPEPESRVKRNKLLAPFREDEKLAY
jgi:hypothetical protein